MLRITLPEDYFTKPQPTAFEVECQKMRAETNAMFAEIKQLMADIQSQCKVETAKHLIKQLPAITFVIKDFYTLSPEERVKALDNATKCVTVQVETYMNTLKKGN